MDKAILSTWLKAGYMDKSVLYETEDGMPQDRLCSPRLSKLSRTEVDRRLERAKEGTRRGPYPAIA